MRVRKMKKKKLKIPNNFKHASHEDDYWDGPEKMQVLIFCFKVLLFVLSPCEKMEQTINV
jgi:hypothetical protein